MTISYNRLFKMLIDRKMKKKDLCELAGISSSTMSKMGREELISMEIIAKICLKLNCTVDDILEILPDEAESDGRNFEKDNDKKDN
jgi:Predicted transcriptional regulator